MLTRDTRRAAREGRTHRSAPTGASIVYDPDRHHRRSIRLQGYDYARAGAYFVTIVAQHRECLFGTITDGTMHANDAGRMVEFVWNDLVFHHPDTETLAHMVMPNHFHGIVMLTNDVQDGPFVKDVDWRSEHEVRPRSPLGEHKVRPYTNDRRPSAEHPPPSPDQHHGHSECVNGTDARRGEPCVRPSRPNHPTGTTEGSLARLVQRFKSTTTHRYIRGVKKHNWPSFPGRLWQRNYYERVIRRDEELLSIHQYILDNPARWSEDQENPHRP